MAEMESIFSTEYLIVGDEQTRTNTFIFFMRL